MITLFWSKWKVLAAESDYMCSSMRLFKNFNFKQNFTFRGQNLGRICHLLRELLNELPIHQIDSYLAVGLLAFPLNFNILGLFTDWSRIIDSSYRYTGLISWTDLKQNETLNRNMINLYMEIECIHEGIFLK